MNTFSHARRVALVLAFALTLAACIDQSPNSVVFDQLLESATFHNKLITKVIVYRDYVPLDTLDSREQRLYPINRKGAIRHGWRILPPIDNTGDRTGEQRFVDLNVQYRVRAEYTIDNDAIDGVTLFTPRIANFSASSLRITGNYGEDDQVSTNHRIGAGGITSTEHAPYFVWHSRSNVQLTSPNFGYYYLISRTDTTVNSTLKLDPREDGSGATEPIVIY